MCNKWVIVGQYQHAILGIAINCLIGSSYSQYSECSVWYPLMRWRRWQSVINITISSTWYRKSSNMSISILLLLQYHRMIFSWKFVIFHLTEWPTSCVWCVTLKWPTIKTPMTHLVLYINVYMNSIIIFAFYYDNIIMYYVYEIFQIDIHIANYFSFSRISHIEFHSTTTATTTTKKG